MKIILKKKNLKKLLILIIILIAIFPFLISIHIRTQSRKYISSDYNQISTRVAIVFGAGLNHDGSTSDILEDRVQTAVNLYQENKIEKIIMSGDNRFQNYNEPQRMIELAQERGVDPEDLQADYAGRRTYDTCYRAKNIFNLDEAILITQNYHLSRAVYLCNKMGVKSTGVSADLRQYENMRLFKSREILAQNLAFWDLYFRKPKVVLGDVIVI